MMAPTPNAAQDLLVLEPLRFEDQKLDASLISSPHWLYGVHFGATPADKRPQLVTFLPENLDTDVICVEGATIDGRYAAQAEYGVSPKFAGQTIELDYQTVFPEVWSASSVANSGIVVSLGTCGMPQSTQTVIPSVLNGETGLPDRELVINFHAPNTQEVIGQLNAGGTELPLDCTRLDRDRAIKFGFTCSAKLTAATTGEAVFSFLRLNSGRERPGPQAKIMLPNW